MDESMQTDVFARGGTYLCDCTCLYNLLLQTTKMNALAVLQNTRDRYIEKPFDTLRHAVSSRDINEFLIHQPDFINTIVGNTKALLDAFLELYKSAIHFETARQTLERLREQAVSVRVKRETEEKKLYDLFVHNVPQQPEDVDFSQVQNKMGALLLKDEDDHPMDV